MPNLNNQVLGSAIAFIDSQVPDYQSLVAGVKPGTEVVVLDGYRDAIGGSHGLDFRKMGG